MGRVTRKTIAAVLAVLLLSALVLTGCMAERDEGMETTAKDAALMTEEQTVAEDKDVFWIVTDEDSVMNSLVESVTEQFMQEHPDIKINLQILPTDDQILDDTSYVDSREIMLQQLRTQILAGRGPDVYLLPTGGSKYQMLFEDVNLAMRNGLFEDISEYYEADTELRTEELISGVMDAGVLGGHRYILPLRYDMPVAYVDVAQFEALGGSMDIFERGIMDIYQRVLSLNDTRLAIGAYTTNDAAEAFSMNFLGEVIDYDKHRLLLQTEDLVSYLETVQAVRAMAEVEQDNWERLIAYSEPSNLADLFSRLEFWTDYECMYVGRLQDYLDNSAYAKLYEMEIAAIPIADANGKVSADITYYGAIGYGSNKVELAYDYLRLFLTEQYQWVENWDSCAFTHYFGWPVRQPGDVSSLWSMRQLEIGSFGVFANPDLDEEIRSEQLELRESFLDESFKITEEDLLPIMNDIACAQFPIQLEWDLNCDVILELNESLTGSATDTDIKALAEDWLKELEWHLYEG